MPLISKDSYIQMRSPYKKVRLRISSSQEAMWQNRLRDQVRKSQRRVRQQPNRRTGFTTSLKVHITRLIQQEIPTLFLLRLARSSLLTSLSTQRR